ncbi:inner membrane protein YiaA [Colwellia sp. RSH04]|uniref:inner membrane protein YiaA n=1 Tax=Colwellia sp. RSH04 TaxID=2305464 RepID=UPI000E5675A7|nr:inner membrane protein YiaA [Colwellia sp. RSH04]RHW75765.1 hypothetical protein D1094_11630 [Colwellia sp. RSH04]
MTTPTLATQVTTQATIQATIPTKSYTLASVAALLIGSFAYAIGLYNADMALNEKGYYLIVLLFGLFSMVSVQKAVRDEREGIQTSKIYTRICWASSAIAISLLIIGLYNAQLLLSEKGFYAMAYTLSIFSVVVMQKNIRDKACANKTDTGLIQDTDIELEE